MRARETVGRSIVLELAVTLEQVYNEFALGAFLHGLSLERQPWSSGLLQQLKHQVNLDAVESLCTLEDANQTMHGNPAARAMAVRISPSPVLALPAPSSGRKPPVVQKEAIQAVLLAINAAWTQPYCFVCNGAHTTDRCQFLDLARTAASAARQERNGKRNDRRTVANAASAPSPTPSASIVSTLR